MPNSMNPVTVHTFKPYIHKSKAKKTREYAEEYPQTTNSSNTSS